MHKATYNGGVAQLAMLVSSHVYARGIYELTPLRLSIRDDHGDAVRILLAAVADLKLENGIETC
jgi:hypothetical protein